MQLVPTSSEYPLNVLLFNTFWGFKVFLSSFVPCCHTVIWPMGRVSLFPPPFSHSFIDLILSPPPSIFLATTTKQKFTFLFLFSCFSPTNKIPAPAAKFGPHSQYFSQLTMAWMHSPPSCQPWVDPGGGGQPPPPRPNVTTLYFGIVLLPPGQAQKCPDLSPPNKATKL
mmetsp:Transcript_48721/g.86720  ORF Transcript_48721/g.86720 Transcript_48721/m.86720 type:complete len:169 (-) Transcript_48721:335-841(-)